MSTMKQNLGLAAIFFSERFCEMTTKELAAIEAQLNTILPPPWRYDEDYDCVWSSAPVGTLGRVCDASARWATHDPEQVKQIKANMEFIASAPQTIQMLIDEIRLRGEEATRKLEE